MNQLKTALSSSNFWVIFVFNIIYTNLTFGLSPIKPVDTISLPGGIKTYEYQLKNGLTVFLTPNKKAPQTSVYHWVKAGSLQESPGTTGIAHLFEHMMFRPIDKNSKPFFDRIKELGGHVNANTRFYATVYTSSVPHKNLKKLLDIESERFMKLNVSDELLNVERKAVWSEYSTKFDANPIMALYYSIYRNAFPNHPYGWTVIGEREDLEKIKASDCNQFFQKYYKPNNVGLFIAGDFKKENVIKWIEERYGPWIPGENSVLPPAKIPGDHFISFETKAEAPARNTVIGFRTPEFNELNNKVLNISDFILGDSSYSLIQRQLVFDNKLASTASSFNNEYDSGMSKFFSILLPKSSIDQVISEVLKIPDMVEKMSDEKFEDYVTDFIIQNQEACLRNEDLNSKLSLSWGKWGSIKYLSDILQNRFNVQKSEVVHFLKQYLNKSNLVLVTNKEAAQ